MKKILITPVTIAFLAGVLIWSNFLLMGYAADVRVLKGTVVTPERTPAADRSLAISGLDRGLPSRIPITTDNQGNFSVFNLPPGKYKIVPQHQPDSAGIPVNVKSAPVQKLDAPIELGQ